MPVPALPLLFEPSLKFIFDNINNIKVIFECTNKQTTEYVLFMPCAIILARPEKYISDANTLVLIGTYFFLSLVTFLPCVLLVLSFSFPCTLNDDGNILLALVCCRSTK